jgi:hypothetical protein
VGAFDIDAERSRLSLNLSQLSAGGLASSPATLTKTPQHHHKTQTSTTSSST